MALKSAFGLIAAGIMGVQTTPTARPTPSSSQVRRWRQYLADERAEAAVYRDIASRRTGEEREILLALAEAEGRHEQHWLDLLGDDVGKPRRGDLRTRILGVLARRFGSVFVLALAQRAEARSGYDDDADATPTMAADEAIHEEVVRGLATRGRNRISGTFRAAVFGANDGLVSNLALVLGIGASGASTSTVLLTGLAGLLAGALSMGAGEYVSVRSQRELLEASRPGQAARRDALPHLDVDANELALVYRARGMEPDEAQARADQVLGSLDDHRRAAAGVRGRRRARVHRHRGRCRGGELLLLRVGGGDPGAAVPAGRRGAAPRWCGRRCWWGSRCWPPARPSGCCRGRRPAKRALRQLAIGYGAAACDLPARAWRSARRCDVRHLNKGWQPLLSRG